MVEILDRFMESSYLKRYIASKGAEIPFQKNSGWELDGYQPGKECIFCESNLEEFNAVYIYNPIELTRQLLPNEYCCDSCQEVVDDMIIREYPDLFEIDPVGTDVESLEYRLHLFNMGRHLEPEIEKYMIHLNPSIDTWIEHNEPERCYFCDKFTNNTKVKILDAPVRNELELTGGQFRCCSSHEADLKDPYNANYTTTCFKCNKVYLITPEEMENRRISLTRGLHMCPSCTYTAINNLGINDRLFYKPSNNVIRVSKPTRFNYLTCDFCDDTIVIDLSIDHKTLANKHYQGNKIKCIKCGVLKLTKANGNKIAYRFRDNYYVIITHEAGYWVYRISKIKQTQETILLKSPPKLTKDIRVAILEANNRCWELLPLLKQTELWQNPS